MKQAFNDDDDERIWSKNGSIQTRNGALHDSLADSRMSEWIEWIG